jgi:hypothetical protein
MGLPAPEVACTKYERSKIQVRIVMKDTVWSRDQEKVLGGAIDRPVKKAHTPLLHILL